MSLTTLAPTAGRRAAVLPGHRPAAPGPSESPALFLADGPVVPVRCRRVYAIGGVAAGSTVDGDLLVPAHDLDGAPWWIAASAVWVDADQSSRPSTPRSIGLATARTQTAAVLAGVSDRLGWEAALAFVDGGELPLIDAPVGADGVVVLDGRLGHDVPTVVIVGDDLLRWGAGTTWDRAMHRALFPPTGLAEEQAELEELGRALARAGIGIARVELGTVRLREAGIVRCSVQLLDANDDAGRRWDGAPLE